MPEAACVRHWAGLAIAPETFRPRRPTVDQPCGRYIQRPGERPQAYHCKGFAGTRSRAEGPTLTADFPDRWPSGAFFRFDQDCGWQRAGTLHLHPRRGQMTMALLAQALSHPLRHRLGAPLNQWAAVPCARAFFSGLEGDVRVPRDTRCVTCYNAPQAEQGKEHFAQLPQRLEKEGVDPRGPWLCNFKLDFRFKWLHCLNNAS